MQVIRFAYPISLVIVMECRVLVHQFSSSWASTFSGPCEPASYHIIWAKAHVRRALLFSGWLLSAAAASISHPWPWCPPCCFSSPRLSSRPPPRSLLLRRPPLPSPNPPSALSRSSPWHPLCLSIRSPPSPRTTSTPFPP